MVNNLEIITNLLKIAKRKGAQQADAINFFGSSTSVTTRFGKLENVECSQSSGFGLRVIIGKKQAIVSSTNTANEILDELVTQAVHMASLAPDDKYIDLAEKNILSNKTQDLDLFDDSEPSIKQLFEMAAKTEEAALAVQGVTNSEGAEAMYSQNNATFVTSNGFEGEYRTSTFSFSTSVLAGEGTKMERDYDFAAKRFLADLEEPEIIGRNAAQRAVRRLNPRRVKTCVVPVIFDPRVAKSLLSSFSSAINGSSVACGATFLKNSMEKNIFKNGINIINNPHIKRGLASKPYDAEGVTNSKISMVENGILKNWLLDIRSANQLGLKTNGCATRSISSPPIPSSGNLYIENGIDSPQSLISSVKSGFYVTETSGMGINILTGDYSQGASGFWIENGKITYAVSEVTIAGFLPEMFLQLTPANDLEFRYGTNSPTLLIERMTVAGE